MLTIVIIMFFLSIHCRSKPSTTLAVFYLENRNEKTETAVFTIKTNRNQNGKLKSHRAYIYRYYNIYMHVYW